MTHEIDFNLFVFKLKKSDKFDKCQKIWVHTYRSVALHHPTLQIYLVLRVYCLSCGGLSEQQTTSKIIKGAFFQKDR